MFLPGTYPLHCYLTHVLSELLQRWIPLPAAGAEGRAFVAEANAQHLACKEWTANDWLNYANAARDAPRLPWAIALRRQQRVSVELLCTTLAEQFFRTKVAGVRYLAFSDRHYPWSLRFLSDPPAAVMLSGDPILLQRPAIAVVGARKATAFSYAYSEMIGHSAALSGYAVVSGGAIGCDIAAHKAVRRTGLRPCPAIVVMPCGLSQCIPQVNAKEFAQLQQADAIFLSERLWHSAVRPRDFRARNRIIAGLVQTVVLIHAAQRSGAMMTVTKGLAEGRDILVLRPPPEDVRYEGNRKLLDEGATGFSSADEFLSILRENRDWHQEGGKDFALLLPSV